MAMTLHTGAMAMLGVMMMMMMTVCVVHALDCGDITCQNAGLLTACDTVKTIMLDHCDVTAVSSSVTYVSGAVTISNNANLKTITLPELSATDGSLTVQGNQQLSSMTMNKLQRVPSFVLQGNPVLTDVHMNVADALRTVSILSNAALTMISLPLFSIESLAIKYNPNLAVIMLPKLYCISGDADLRYNTLLGRVHLQTLAYVGQLRMSPVSMFADLRSVAQVGSPSTIEVTAPIIYACKDFFGTDRNVVRCPSACYAVTNLLDLRFCLSADSVTLAGSEITRVWAPGLTYVNRDINIAGSTSASVNFTSLEYVSGSFVVSGLQIDAPVLNRVRMDVNVQLTKYPGENWSNFEASALTRINGRLNAVVGDVLHFANLQSVGTIMTVSATTIENCYYLFPNAVCPPAH